MNYLYLTQAWLVNESIVFGIKLPSGFQLIGQIVSYQGVDTLND